MHGIKNELWGTGGALEASKAPPMKSTLEWSYNPQNSWGTNYRVYKLTLVGFVAAAAL